MKFTYRNISILLLAFLMISPGCNKNRDNESGYIYNNKRIRDAFISYMSEPMFRNKDFVQQVTGTEADLKLYDLDEKALYFVINKRDFDSTTTLSRITIDPGNAEFGFEQNEKVFLGAYTLQSTSRFLFRIPRNDFRADTSVIVKVILDEAEYNITAFELADFAENISVYGGETDAETSKQKYMANHGAFVSKGVEPSLRRLCNKITSGESKPERIAQMLLDFVTHNIQFNADEAGGGYEIMKRPNEVLLSGNADCSGMTVLYASLLEQFAIDYRLLYFEGHIAVGVEGKFSSENGLSAKIDDEVFYMAETTARGFLIGKTRLLKSSFSGELKYTQKPGRDKMFVAYDEK
jgi:transglutaminase-like putative cysteine protease